MFCGIFYLFEVYLFYECVCICVFVVVFGGFSFWPLLAACGIPVPRSEMEPVPPVVETWILNLWTAREVLVCVCFDFSSYFFRVVGGFWRGFLLLLF